MADTQKLADALMGNFNAANKALNMTPQEQALYQRHLTNLWGNGGVTNPDGTRSSLYQANVEGPGGRSYNIPTVYSGQILPVDQAVQKAQQQGWNSFPSYATPEAADNRYLNGMHPFMDRDTAAYLSMSRPDGTPLYPTVGSDTAQNAALLSALTRLK